jgi:predicted RNA-binding Zn-ribbon protein involved in translation (DUF1610 family)
MKMREKWCLSGAEQTIISGLKHPLYTVEFIQEWINRDDLVFINAPAALQAVAAKGFYEAVKAMNAAGGRITYKNCGKEAGSDKKVKDKALLKKVECPQCSTIMRCVASDRVARSYQCPGCQNIKIVKREDNQKEAQHEDD